MGRLPDKLSVYRSIVNTKNGKLFITDNYIIENGRTKFLCVCDCGNSKYIRSDTAKKSKSCGCSVLDIDRKGANGSGWKDGRARTKLYNVWHAIRHRVDDINCKQYKYYGYRGIKMCKEWYDYTVFKAWADANGYLEGMSIERVNVNGDYCPENCTWIKKSLQMRNTRRSRYIEHNGEKKVLSEWAEILGFDQKQQHYKIYRNFKKTGKYNLCLD